MYHKCHSYFKVEESKPKKKKRKKEESEKEKKGKKEKGRKRKIKKGKRKKAKNKKRKKEESEKEKKENRMYSVMFTPENKKEVPSLLQGNPNNGNGLVKSCITNIVIYNTYTCSHLNCKYNLYTHH